MTLPGTPLTTDDLARLAKSGISAELAAAAMLRRVDSREGGAIVGRNGNDDYSGILIPYRWPGEDRIREYRLRRDRPELEYKADGSTKERNKYLSPPGRRNMLYFAPETDPAWLMDATLPVLLTEGEKKALGLWALAWHEIGDAGERPRWLPIGLGGVWNWRGTVGKAAGPDGDRRDVKGPIADLQNVKWNGRRLTVVFDANARTKPEVQAARWQLSKYLRSRGAQVSWFNWPTNTPSHVNGIDDLLGDWGLARTLETIQAFTKPALANYGDQQDSPREFTKISEERFTMTVPALAIAFDVDRLRRERHELVGELTVMCDLPGARTYNRVLIAADFNLSSTRARSEWARLLADRAHTPDLDWPALVEEFCQRVLEAERRGQPAQDLRDFPDIDPQQRVLRAADIDLPRDHPSIIFGDGGSMKSYLALWIAGQMAQQGLRVALFDWELSGPDHRFRLKRLFGAAWPRVLYARCERSLVSEADRLRRIVREEGIEYVIYDSVAYACNGGPEGADVAGEYFRAVRQIGGGSLHVAHISKGENADQKPFGSVFWYNSARAIWFVKASDESPDQATLDIALFHRKANLGAKIRTPVAFRARFAEDRTTFERLEAATVPEFAEGMSLKRRVYELVKRGALTPEQIAEELEADLKTVKRYVRDHERFVVLENGRIGVKARG